MSVPVTVEQVNAFVKKELPFSVEMGISCEALKLDEAVGRWRFNRKYLRPVDFVSGPVMMALADAVLYFAVFTRGGIVPGALTSELKMNFLRPAVGRKDLLARARILKRGRRVLYGVVDVWEEGSEDRLVAHATASYLPPHGD